MQTKFLCISVLRVASGPRVKLASYKSALNPPVVYSTDRSKAVVPVLVLLFVALWFILRGDLFYILNSFNVITYRIQLPSPVKAIYFESFKKWRISGWGYMCITGHFV